MRGISESGDNSLSLTLWLTTFTYAVIFNNSQYRSFKQITYLLSFLKVEIILSARAAVKANQSPLHHTLLFILWTVYACVLRCHSRCTAWSWIRASLLQLPSDHMRSSSAVVTSGWLTAPRVDRWTSLNDSSDCSNIDGGLRASAG